MAVKQYDSGTFQPVDCKGFISANIFTLKWTGQWFSNDSLQSLRYLRHFAVKIAFLFAAYIFPITGELIYLYYNHEDVSKIAESLYLLLTEFFTPIKVVMFNMNKIVILEIFSHVTSDIFKPTEPEHNDIVTRNIKRARFVAFTYSAMCMTCVYASCLVPIAEHFQVLPTNVKYPYIDVTSSPAYEAIYAFDVIVYKPLGVIIHCGVETLPPVLIACAVSQLEILAFNLENLDLLAERDLAKRGILHYDTREKIATMTMIMKRNIKHHTYIIEFVKKLDDAYTLQEGSQFLLSVLIICLTGVQFHSIDDPIHKPVQILWMLAYLAAMICAVYMVCYFGNDLTMKSEYLKIASYNGPWLSFDAELRRIVTIFRERCNRPLAVKAARFIDISLATFTTLMKWSFNAFAVLNQM